MLVFHNVLTNQLVSDYEYLTNRRQNFFVVATLIVFSRSESVQDNTKPGSADSRTLHAENPHRGLGGGSFIFTFSIFTNSYKLDLIIPIHGINLNTLMNIYLFKSLK